MLIFGVIRYRDTISLKKIQEFLVQRSNDLCSNCLLFKERVPGRKLTTKHVTKCEQGKDRDFIQPLILFLWDACLSQEAYESSENTDIFQLIHVWPPLSLTVPLILGCLAHVLTHLEGDLNTHHDATGTMLVATAPRTGGIHQEHATMDEQPTLMSRRAVKETIKIGTGIVRMIGGGAILVLGAPEDVMTTDVNVILIWRAITHDPLRRKTSQSQNQNLSPTSITLVDFVRLYACFRVALTSLAVGLLAAATNIVKHRDGTSTVLKYNDPPEARKPAEGWRIYVFKGKEQVGAFQFVVEHDPPGSLILFCPFLSQIFCTFIDKVPI
jgi:hypothetical protein